MRPSFQDVCESTVAIDTDQPSANSAKSLCLSIFVTLIPILLICNPLVLGVILSEEASIEVAYILLLDLLAVGIMWLCYRFVRTSTSFYHRAALICFIALPFVLGATEALMLHFRADYQRLIGAQPRPDVFGNGILQRDDRVGWSLRPGASSASPKIIVDDAGRRQTPSPPNGVTTSIHAFGDSFLFGQGVDQDKIAPNLLAEQYRDQAAILNYAVSGYGLDQMVLRLEASLATIKPGDLVIFAPITNDFRRNLITKQLVCTHYEAGFAGEQFPKWSDRQWHYEPLEDHCPELGLPFSRLLGVLKKNLGITERRLVAYADQILHRAKRLTEEKGANFALVFQPNHKECRKGRLDVDLEALTVPFHHLMAACDDFDPAIEYTLSPADYHWNEHGHRWLADTLSRFIEAEGFIEKKPATTSTLPELGADDIQK